MKGSNHFYNHISTDRIDMIDKLAYLYWYENMASKGYKLPPNQTQLYEDVKHEVMDFGFAFLEKNK